MYIIKSVCKPVLLTTKVFRGRQRRRLRLPVRDWRPVRAMTQDTDQAADRDPPHPCGRLASSAPAVGAAPHCDECVLDRLRNHVDIRAAVAKPRRQPRLMAHIQLAQRGPVTIGDRGNQLRITRRQRIHTHVYTVAQPRLNGSRGAAVTASCSKPSSRWSTHARDDAGRLGDFRGPR